MLTYLNTYRSNGIAAVTESDSLRRLVQTSKVDDKQLSVIGPNINNSSFWRKF